MERTCQDCHSKFAAPGRTICYSCKDRRYKERNPMKYAFKKLRGNARRRGKEFDLTFDDFKDFCRKTEYLIGKGRTAESYHIDRIDPRRGYCRDNIQLLTNSENVKKCLRWSYNYHKREVEFWVSTDRNDRVNEDECPF